jgi:hypothetical protein
VHVLVREPIGEALEHDAALDEVIEADAAPLLPVEPPYQVMAERR